MLVLLLPSDITKFWPMIAKSLELTMPPITIYTADRENNVIESLLAGEMQAWVIQQDKEILGIVLTTITYDVCTKVKNLLVYSFALFTDLDVTMQSSVWNTGFRQLLEFANLNNCHKLVGYTKDEKLIRMADYLNADKSVFVSIPIGG